MRNSKIIVNSEHKNETEFPKARVDTRVEKYSKKERRERGLSKLSVGEINMWFKWEVWKKHEWFEEENRDNIE